MTGGYHRKDYVMEDLGLNAAEWRRLTRASETRRNHYDGRRLYYISDADYESMKAEAAERRAKAAVKRADRSSNSRRNIRRRERYLADPEFRAKEIGRRAEVRAKAELRRDEARTKRRAERMAEVARRAEESGLPKLTGGVVI